MNWWQWFWLTLGRTFPDEAALFLEPPALRDNPEDAAALERLSILYRERGENERALECAERRVLVQPGDADGLRELVLLYLEGEMREQAVTALSHARESGMPGTLLAPLEGLIRSAARAREALPEGVLAVNYLFDASIDVPAEARLQTPLSGNPVSCPKIRKRIPHITGQVDCNHSFGFASDHYPTPRLHLQTGVEGQAAAVYFGVLGACIRNPAFTFTRRSRRPPRDPANAMLSFGYTLLNLDEKRIATFTSTWSLKYFSAPVPAPR